MRVIRFSDFKINYKHEIVLGHCNADGFYLKSIYSMFTHNASVTHRTLILVKWIEFSVLFYFENDHGCDSELSSPGEMETE